jgi:hypothetical protein
MRKISTILVLLGIVGVPTADAAGVNMRWTSCFGDGGVPNRNTACNSNVGSNRLVGSFVLDSDLPQVVALEFYIDVATASPTLPAWWQFKNTGSCRAASLSLNASADPSALNCVDWSSGQALGGLASYVVGFSGPNTARITGEFAVAGASAADLVAGQEYFAFNALINNQKTVGTGACAGCTTPACVALNTVKVYQNGNPLPVTQLTGPTNGFDSHFVSWQGGGGVGGTCAFGTPGGVPVITSVLGRGTVNRSVSAINYPVGTPLTLSAVPLPGARFVAWSGDTATTQATLDIVVEHTVSYVATFERDPASSAGVVAVGDVPGDQGSAVTVDWARSPLDDAAYPGLVCCYQIERHPSSAPADPWVSVGTVSATHSAMYEQAVATPADSTQSDPALFQYRVLTLAASDTAQWVSNVVAGYSVDNLAPPDPASVSGAIASGIATMFWPAVSVPDLAGYRIYRAADRVPPTDAGHRIATLTATGYTDSPGYFANYVVTAMDTHGNESHGTVFSPVNATGVDGRPAPVALTVGNPTPSPMGRQMRISLGLPREMNVSVDVLDPHGRLVRRLADGVSPAGWSTLAWDARDADGHAAAAGLYFVRVRTAAGDKIKRLVVLP